jgi:adenine-specific DNA-methyltransferase
MMKKRLELLWDFLREDGSIWISIDDDECHYLKILCDQLWGRDKYLTMIVRQKNESPSNYERRKIVHMHDYVLVYCKNKEKCILNTIPIQYIEEYFEEDNIGRKWIAKSILTPYNELDDGKYSYEIVTPSGRKLIPPYGRQWSVEADEFERLRNNNKIWFGISGDEYPNLKRFVDEMDLTQAVSLWSKKMVGSNQEARHEVSNYNDKEFFYVAKPERFIQLILTIATNEGDWVLDPFLGSGTTAAVSMKLKRKWIGIEKGKQCEEFCLPRLKSVMIGDNVGISENVGWRGGGGFYFCQDCAED